MKNESSLLVGVLGGMGPEATVDFMSKLISFTPGDDDQDHIRLLVDQNPTVPNRQDALLRGGISPGPVLADMARGLEAGGCAFLVMPCNTAHAFQDDIKAAVDIPFVSIIDATLDAAKDAKCRVIDPETDSGFIAPQIITIVEQPPNANKKILFVKKFGRMEGKIRPSHPSSRAPLLIAECR